MRDIRGDGRDVQAEREALREEREVTERLRDEESRLERASELARSMVMDFGMSRLGRINYRKSGRSAFLATADMPREHEVVERVPVFAQGIPVLIEIHDLQARALLHRAPLRRKLASDTVHSRRIDRLVQFEQRQDRG